MSQHDSNSGSTPTPTLENTQASELPSTEEEGVLATEEEGVPATEEEGVLATEEEVEDTFGLMDDDEELEEKPFEYTTPLGFKSKLNLTQLTDFGFADADEALALAIRNSKRNSAIGGGTDIRKSKRKNKTMDYGGSTDFDDDDNLDRDYAADYDDSEEEGEEEEEEQEVEVEVEVEEEADTTEDLWEDLLEDEEDEMDPEEYEEELAEALAKEVEEYKRQQAIRMKEINRRKAILMESYLKIAPVMISHRKKNIYLQDYLYNLASRKGVLRGDVHLSSSIHTTASNASTGTEEGTVASKALKEQQGMEDAMNRRIDKIIEEAGQFEGMPSEQGPDEEDEENHGHHHGHGIKIRNHHFLLAKILRDSVDGTGKLQIREKPKEKMLALKKAWLLAKEGHRKRDTTVSRLMKVAGDALSAFKRRRCRRDKQKQIIIVQNFLRQKHGTCEEEEADETEELGDSEEQSEKEQNRAKKKSETSQSKKEPIQQQVDEQGIAHLNEQWTQSLERILELRRKKAKLEEDQRLLLMKKMADWEFLEQRNQDAVDGVYEFLTNIGGRVVMTRAEMESYRQGLDLFHKQLFTLHQSMLQQVERSYKVQSDLYMLQRKAKDLEQTGSGEDALNNFTTSDFKRMSLENEEARQKLIARQSHLAEEHEKLKAYMGKVAKSFKTKHKLLSVLFTGKHNLKYLWELCTAEKENLLKKLAEIRSFEKHHRDSFMLISLLENKRCLTHFESLKYNVQQLKTRQQELKAHLAQTDCKLRIMNVRYTDVRQRLCSQHREKAEKARKDNFEQQKARMRKQRDSHTPQQNLYGLLAAGCGDSAEDAYLRSSISIAEVKSSTTYCAWSGTTKKKSTKLPLVKNCSIFHV